jgi:hypothetical protein
MSKELKQDGGSEGLIRMMSLICVKSRPQTLNYITAKKYRCNIGVWASKH